MNKYDKCVQYILDNQTHFYRIAYCYVNNEHDAQDVVQNTIIKALENINSLRCIGAIRTWFYRILVNESLNFINRTKKEIPYEQFDTEYTDSFYHPDDEIMSLVLGLPQDMRTIIILHVYEELTLRECAAIARIPLSTAKTRYYAALKQLRNSMEDHNE